MAHISFFRAAEHIVRPRHCQASAGQSLRGLLCKVHFPPDTFKTLEGGFLKSVAFRERLYRIDCSGTLGRTTNRSPFENMPSQIVLALILCAGSLLSGPTESAASPFEELADLTGQVQPVASLVAQDNFSNEIRYEVTVKNVTGTRVIADSLIIVLDKISSRGGSEREPLRKEPLLNLIEILGQDGETPDGKPYFQVPTDGKADLDPYAQSQPVAIHMRNPSYLSGITPSFRVYGQYRPPEKAEQKTLPPPARATKSPFRTKQDPALDNLIRLLIKKGILTPKEWHDASTASRETSQRDNPPAQR